MSGARNAGGTRAGGLLGDDLGRTLTAPGAGPLGSPRLHLRVTDSTNDRARALALAGAPHGTLVTASAQSAGRGRQGRRWSAPPGSALLMSLVLRSGDVGAASGSGAALPTLLPLRAAVAVCDAVGPRARVKWPNDIVFVRESADGESPDGKRVTAAPLAKLAGILVEGRPQEGWAVLGIGINVAVRLEDLPQELRATAATLGEPPGAVEEVLARVLAALARRLAEPLDQALADWRARDALCGREVSWERGRGLAEGIDESGRLRVACADGERVALDAGEVHLHSTLRHGP